MLLVAMPETECFWTWDHFLSGGHNFEFTLLGVLIFCGLVLLIAHQIVQLPLYSLMTVFHGKALQAFGTFILPIHLLGEVRIRMSNKYQRLHAIAPAFAIYLRI